MFNATKARERDAAREAARWFARLMAPHSDAGTQADWQRWLESCPENRRAWTKVESVQSCFSAVPREVALPTLQGMDGRRRQMLRLACAGAASVPLGMLALQAPQAWAQWNAAYRTAVGEITPLPMQDGTVAILDTDSAADLVYDAHARRVVLRNGRIYIKTRPDEQARPLIVQTAFGDIQAHSSEFVVCVGSNHGQVRVNQDEVCLVPRDADSQRIAAHQWADFSSTRISNLRHVDSPLFAAWRNGSLVAVNLPLAKFVERFRAYRPGMLLLDDTLAELPVSGTFPLARSDLALNALENSYPVEIRRLTRYVTWIVPRVRQI